MATLAAVADLLEQAARELRAATNAGRWYSADRLPPGAKSWRAARETARREGLPMLRAGRDVLIDASEWDRWLDGRTTGRLDVGQGDEATLAKMGIRLGGAK